MGGGKYDYAKAYAKYGAGKYSDSDFERYVDSKGDLSHAWKMVDTYKKGGDMSGFAMHGHMTPAQQAEYWINRGATSKAAFGRAHAAEDAALYAGTYHGGTKVRKGTPEYDAYFGDGGTRFESSVQDGLLGGDGSGSGSSSGNTGGLLDAAWADNLNFPMLLSEYNAPNYAPMTNPWGGATIGASYMPWTVEGMANVPEQARRYIAPELTLEHPRYITNPLGLLQLPPDWEDLIDVEDEEEEEEEQEQGRNVGTDEGTSLPDQQGHKAQQKKAQENAKALVDKLGKNAGD